jgi:methylglutaconyl-CoA hydratase
MMNWKNICLNIEGDRAEITLNRPKLHNALNPELISELNSAFDEISITDEIRFVVLSGEGKSFCAGADINWLASAREKTKMDSWQEYLKFPELLKKIHRFPKITIAAVHGNVRGGGNGLVAACDFAVAEISTVFAFGEIKLGIVPATIMPFISKRVSVQNMKKLMYSGSDINTTEAREIGLIDYVADNDMTMKVVGKLIDNLKNSAPNALQTCKQLLLGIETGEITIDSSEFTSGVLADLVHSGEGLEGLQAFLDKRKPVWNKMETEQY